MNKTIKLRSQTKTSNELSTGCSIISLSKITFTMEKDT